MKVSCVRENLAKVLNGLSRVVTTSSTLPILGNILMKTDQGRLKISATDLEMGINYWIGAKIDGEGEITIPARIFNDYINNNADSNIEIQVEGNVVKVVSEHYSTRINGLSAEEFPIIPELKTEKVIEIEVDVLRDALTKVVFAAAIGDTNPTLAGVLFKTDGKWLKIVATDSYRLSERLIELKEISEQEISVIVPTKTIQELNKLLSLAKGIVKVILADNQVMFKMEEIEVVSRLIEGNYPAYESIMPQNFLTKIIVSTKDLLRDTKMAAVFSKETQKIKLTTNKETNRLISMAKGQGGENVASCAAEIEGVDGEIIFNTKYLADVLNVVGSVKIAIELTDKLKPGLIRPMDDEWYRYIIMPVKN